MISLCLFLPFFLFSPKFIVASISPLPAWSIELFHLFCNLILLGLTAHQTSALVRCYILLYSLVVLPPVEETVQWHSKILIYYATSLSCYHKGLGRPYLSCPHPATHSTFRPIISLPPYFAEKIGAIQPTDWNIKFLWIQTWTLTYLFLFILREWYILLLVHSSISTCSCPTELFRGPCFLSPHSFSFSLWGTCCVLTAYTLDLVKNIFMMYSSLPFR